MPRTCSPTGRSCGSPNIITFGLLFWLLDEGGPRLRAEHGRPDPDFQFPQDATRRAGWSPRLSDYLYVSLTNAIAARAINVLGT